VEGCNDRERREDGELREQRVDVSGESRENREIRKKSVESKEEGKGEKRESRARGEEQRAAHKHRYHETEIT
jgi:hypothetical protein